MRNLLHISEATSLALHTMALLTVRRDRRMTNTDIAQVLGASVHTLAKVMNSLAHAGLVSAVRGPRGGFKLRREPGEIRLLDIYEAVEGPLGKPECLLSRPICEGDTCILGGLIESVHNEVRVYLASKTLAELAGEVKLRIPA